MPKRISDLKKAICAFTRRSAASFAGENGDMLLVAINHAKDYAQRGVDLERAYVHVGVAVAEIANGGSLDQAKLTPDLTVPIELKCARKAFLRSTDGTLLPVPLISRQAYVDRLERQTGALRGDDRGNTVATECRARAPVTLVLKGDNFFSITPESTSGLGDSLVVYFDGIRWLPDFVDENETSFLLTYGFDFMMFRSVYELNFLLKEDQRFSISTTILNDAWESFKGWNATVVANATDDLTLD